MRRREIKKAFSSIRVNWRHSRIIFFFVLFAVACPVGIFSHGACSKSPTDSKGLSIAGSVKLEGQSEYSGTVADFGLRILDFGLQMGRDVKNRQGWSRMVKEFPMVGIPISQATEFDHCLAKPIYQTQTKADGSY